MSYTKFGELVRVLRIRNHEVMGDLAKVLEVSLPFLSSVENGRKNVPPEWISIIANHYKLTEEETKELEEAADESKTQYKIVANGAGINQRRAALKFARSFDKMDDETALKVLELLKSSKEGD